jgi:transcriptional regulator with XRE-family HTH domain
MTLGERVLIVRRRRDMTQRELAKAAGLNTNTISRLEQGDLKDLGGQAIANIARALGTSADFLLGLSERDEESEMSPIAPALALT